MDKNQNDDIGDHCLFLITLTGWTKWWYWWSLLIPDHFEWVDNRWYWWSLLIPDHLKWVDKRWYWWSLLYSWALQMGALILWYWWSLHAYSWSLWWYWWLLLISEHSTWFHKNNKNTMVKLVPHPGSLRLHIPHDVVQPFTHVLWVYSLWVVVAFISFWHVVSFPPWVPASSLSKAPLIIAITLLPHNWICWVELQNPGLECAVR